LFRSYHSHCLRPDRDSLFNLLNAAHSFNDRLQKATGADFFEHDEFVALKALRNLFHHEAELVSEVRSIAVAGVPAISSDLLYLCLIPSTLVARSIDQLAPKRRPIDEPRIRSALKWYGSVVNVNPCIFNFMVHVFERVRSLHGRLTSEEYEEFAASYAYETAQGHSHFVTGDIACHAGSVQEVLARAFASVT
jgi:hypothetical protein